MDLPGAHKSDTPCGAPPARLPIGGSEDRSRDNAARGLRRLLEAGLVRSRGQIGEEAAVLVWAAARAFRRAQRIEKRLREDKDKFSPETWLAMQTRATALDEAVVRHVKALGLGARPAETDHLDAMRVIEAEAVQRLAEQQARLAAERQAAQGAPDAAAGQLEQQGGI